MTDGPDQLLVLANERNSVIALKLAPLWMIFNAFVLQCVAYPEWLRSALYINTIRILDCHIRAACDARVLLVHQADVA